ncbi:MAG: hypothetical protein AB1567_09880, partial [bacterium]
DIATAIKQSDPSKLKITICGSSSTGYIEGKFDADGNFLVYDQATAAVGTTTSNLYIKVGSEWVAVQGIANRIYTEEDFGYSHTYFKTVGATTTATVISAVAGQKIYLKGFMISNTSATDAVVTFFLGGVEFWKLSVNNKSVSGWYDGKISASSEALTVTTSAGDINIRVQYLQQL